MKTPFTSPDVIWIVVSTNKGHEIMVKQGPVPRSIKRHEELQQDELEFIVLFVR